MFERDLVTGITTLVTVGLGGNSEVNRARAPPRSVPRPIRRLPDHRKNLVSLDNQDIEQVYVRDRSPARRHGERRMTEPRRWGRPQRPFGHRRPGDQRADGRLSTSLSQQRSNLIRPGRRDGRLLPRPADRHHGPADASAVDGHAVGGTAARLSAPTDGTRAFATSASNVVSLPTNGQTNVYVRGHLDRDLDAGQRQHAGHRRGQCRVGPGHLLRHSRRPIVQHGRPLPRLPQQGHRPTPGVVTANRNLYARDLEAGQTVLITAELHQERRRRRRRRHRGVGRVQRGRPLRRLRGHRRATWWPATTTVSTTCSCATCGGRDDRAGLARGARSCPAAYPTRGRVARFRHARRPLRRLHQHDPHDLRPGPRRDVQQFGSEHIFVRDRQTGTAAGRGHGRGRHRRGRRLRPLITPDGRYVAFLGGSQSLVQGVSYYSGTSARPPSSAATCRRARPRSSASTRPAPTTSTPASRHPDRHSADGRYIAYISPDPTGVAGTTEPATIHGRSTCATSRTARPTWSASDLANDGQIRGNSSNISISADGRYVLFTSTTRTWRPTTPMASPTSSAGTARPARWPWSASTRRGTGPGNATSGGYRPVDDPDGRYVVFTSQATDLIPNDTVKRDEVYVRDMTTGTPALVSVAGTGTGPAQLGAIDPSISGDGRYVVFVSTSPDLTTSPRTTGTRSSSGT